MGAVMRISCRGDSLYLCGSSRRCKLTDRFSAGSFSRDEGGCQTGISSLDGVCKMNRLTKAAVVALALATTAAPMLAQAQDRGDRREWRQDRRDDRREWRQDRRDDRRELRQDRREWRQDRRHDRRDWRQDQRRHDRWSRDNRDWWR